MTRSNKLLLLSLVLVGLTLLSRFVWLPDVAFAPARTLAFAHSQDGHAFTVTEVWNSDFYLIELRHSNPTGAVEVLVIDPDHPKIWKCKLQMDEKKRQVSISADSKLLAVYTWDKLEMVLRSGYVVKPYVRTGIDWRSLERITAGESGLAESSL